MRVLNYLNNIKSEKNFKILKRIIDKIISIIWLFIFLLATVASFTIAIIASLFGKSQAHYTIRNIVRPIFNLFFPLQIEGEDYIKDSGGMILAGNHTGVLDTAIIEMASKRQVTFLMASWVQRVIVIGWLAKRLKTIPISGKHLAKDLDNVIERLKSGGIICIFPEGTPTSNGKLCEFKKGVAYLHKRSKIPIIPFVIHGGYEAWPWKIGFPTFREVTIQFGEPYCNFEDDEKNITDQLQRKIQYMKDFLEKREKEDLKIPYSDNFLDLMQSKFDIYSSSKALSLKEKDQWNYLTYTELTKLSKCLSNYFINQGIKNEDRIAILSESRPEWAVVFFASIISGAIVVPLDIKLTYDELKPLVINCNPSIICVSPDFIETANQLKSEIPSIKQIFVIDKNKFTEEFDLLDGLNEYPGEKRRERDLDDTALIVYTSGTTGNPKGVMITLRNIVSQITDFDEIYDFVPRESVVSILPLNHMFEITVGLLTMLYRGAQINYIKTLHPKEFTKIMQEKKITRIIAVPAFLKVLKRSIEREIQKSDPISRNLFKIFFKVSKFIPFNFLRKLLFFKVHSSFGGELNEFISGGAPLDNNIAEFFIILGIPVYQGYGLTETGPVVTGNNPKYNRLGSVGKPLPSVAIKISKEGEIWVKGPNIMKGYYNRSDLTNEVIDKDGWFHTGDLGRIDKDGYLYIIGRLKNLIVLSGGNKVQPEEVEAILSKSPIIKESCVVGVLIQEGVKKGSEEIIAVIVPVNEIQKEYQNDIQGLRNIINHEVNRLSKSLTVYKRPDKIVLRMEDFQKTTTGKIKRRNVLDWYYDY